MKKVLLFSFVLLVSGSTLMAQTGQWKLAGNALNGTQKLGSTNNFSLDFITNNVKRMSLTGTGNLGIGTTTPLSKLHLQTGSSGTTPFFQSVITAENSSNAYINLLAPKANETGILFGTSENNVSGGIIYNSTFQGSAPNALQFRTNGNLPRMVLTAEGNVGIGTTAPKASLHVFRGSAGVSPNIESPIVAESSGNAFINLLTPETHVSGILFGDQFDVADGGIVYNGHDNRMEFRSASNVTHMVLTAGSGGAFSKGRLGINTTAPDVELAVVHQDVDLDSKPHGLRIQLSSVNTSWLFAAESHGNLELTRDNDIFHPVGRFDGVSGIYTPLSDARVKKDIEASPDVLEKVLQLNVKKYHFLKNKTDDKKYYGMIAQEVEKIFPEVVYHNKNNVRDYYTMDYSAFGVIAIKAIQELAKTTQEKNERVNKLEDQVAMQQKEIDELKAIVLKGNQSNTSSNAIINTLLTDVSLEQNAPNPFTNTTSIRYTLPQKFTTAQLLITDKSGKTVKQLNVSGTGKGIVKVEASALSAGTYNYSLVIDGKIISTKQMILTK